MCNGGTLGSGDDDCSFLTTLVSIWLLFFSKGDSTVIIGESLSLLVRLNLNFIFKPPVLGVAGVSGRDIDNFTGGITLLFGDFVAFPVFTLAFGGSTSVNR